MIDTLASGLLHYESKRHSANTNQIVENGLICSFQVSSWKFCEMTELNV